MWYQSSMNTSKYIIVLFLTTLFVVVGFYFYPKQADKDYIGGGGRTCECAGYETTNLPPDWLRSAIYMTGSYCYGQVHSCESSPGHLRDMSE